MSLEIDLEKEMLSATQKYIRRFQDEIWRLKIEVLNLRKDLDAERNRSADYLVMLKEYGII